MSTIGTPDDYERICYRSNFLDKVIIRMDSLNRVEQLTDDIPQALHSLARERFPIEEPKDEELIQTTISARDEPKRTTRKRIKWLYHSRDRQAHLTITDDFISIEYDTYHSYEDDLKAKISDICEELNRIIPDQKYKRIGLRYINHIRIPGNDPFDWSEYINEALLCQHSFCEDLRHVSRLFHIIEINGDDHQLRFQFGIHNPDHPAPVRDRAFTLDYDAYTARLIRFGECIGLLDRLHESIQGLFEMSIRDALRDKMVRE